MKILVEKLLITWSMENTTIPVQNNFSLLGNEQMVLSETTENENQNKNTFSSTYEHMDTHTDNMDNIQYYYKECHAHNPLII